MASSSAEPPERDSYRQHLYETLLVKRTRLVTRNGETREWSLIAKRPLPIGSFVGFYTGDYMASNAESLYAVDLGPGQPTIFPFSDEQKIRSTERDRHPLASANEPPDGQHANMHMEPQDFATEEVEGATSHYNHDIAKFFRGLACFTCTDVAAGEQLTWHYGPSYEPHRVRQGYTAGLPCKRVLDGTPFLLKDSASVLQTLPRVPYYCVFPVIASLKSERFRLKRVHVDSDGEESVASSSGSGHEEKYKPRPSARRQNPNFRSSLLWSPPPQSHRW